MSFVLLAYLLTKRNKKSPFESVCVSKQSWKLVSSTKSTSNKSRRVSPVSGTEDTARSYSKLAGTVFVPSSDVSLRGSRVQALYTVLGWDPTE